jgi:hypothetical protein
MTTNQDPRPLTGNGAAAARRAAETNSMTKYIPLTPADRSRNGRRIPRSVKHKGLR